MKRGRPRKRPDLVGAPGEATIDYRENVAGVSITWLCTMFRMDRRTCQKRLAMCPPLRHGVGDAPMFDLAQAAAYLVKPKINIGEWVKSLRPADLPPYLQSEFWDAQNKRQKWEENAGELWRTEKVIEVFADVFKHIKETMQQWQDSIERKEGLTGEQRLILTQLCDGLQDDIYKRLVEWRKSRRTANVAEEMKDIEQADNMRERRPELV